MLYDAIRYDRLVALESWQKLCYIIIIIINKFFTDWQLNLLHETKRYIKKLKRYDTEIPKTGALWRFLVSLYTQFDVFFTHIILVDVSAAILGD